MSTAARARYDSFKEAFRAPTRAAELAAEQAECRRYLRARIADERRDLRAFQYRHVTLDRFVGRHERTPLTDLVCRGESGEARALLALDLDRIRAQVFPVLTRLQRTVLEGWLEGRTPWAIAGDLDIRHGSTYRALGAAVMKIRRALGLETAPDRGPSFAERRPMRIAEGICFLCGNLPLRPRSGGRCAGCWDRFVENQRRRRRELRAAGLCRECRGPLDRPGPTCRSCCDVRNLKARNTR